MSERCCFNSCTGAPGFYREEQKVQSDVRVAVRHLIDSTRTFLDLWNPARDFGGLKEQQWWSVHDQCARVENELARLSRKCVTADVADQKEAAL